MKKVKTWLKEHKKDIMIGIAAAGGTALFFLLKDNKINGIDSDMRLSLRFLKEPKEEFSYNKSHLFNNFNLDNPDLTIKELGKLEDILKEFMPAIDDETKIGSINVNYSKFLI